MKYTAISIVLAIGLTSCPDPITPAEDTRNEKAKEFDVVQLFEHEGCKAYRFNSGNGPVFYINCVSGTGKIADRPETITEIVAEDLE